MTRLFATVPLFLLAGCSQMKMDSLNIERPTATVTGMSVKDVTATGFTMNFDVALINPNAVELPLTAATYKIGLGGVAVADGKTVSKGTLPAGGNVSVVFPVTLTYENVVAAEQAVVKSGGNVPYNLAGTLSVGTKNPVFSDLAIPVQYSGTLALKEVLTNPEALAQNPAAQKLAKDALGNLLGR